MSGHCWGYRILMDNVCGSVGRLKQVLPNYGAPELRLVLIVPGERSGADRATSQRRRISDEP